MFLNSNDEKRKYETFARLINKMNILCHVSVNTEIMSRKHVFQMEIMLLPIRRRS